MQEFKNLVVLAVLAVLLVAGVAAAAAVNPYALLGLAPVLLAIAAILRAVSGARSAHHGAPQRRADAAAANPRKKTRDRNDQNHGRPHRR